MVASDKVQSALKNIKDSYGLNKVVKKKLKRRGDDVFKDDEEEDEEAAKKKLKTDDGRLQK